MEYRRVTVWRHSRRPFSLDVGPMGSKEILKHLGEKPFLKNKEVIQGNIDSLD